MVLESHPPQEIVILLFITDENNKLTVLWGNDLRGDRGGGASRREPRPPARPPPVPAARDISLFES